MDISNSLGSLTGQLGHVQSLEQLYTQAACLQPLLVACRHGLVLAEAASHKFPVLRLAS